jgi:hypothetical protein
MWRHQQLFMPDFFFKEASWIRDSFLPMMGLLAAVLVAVHSRFQEPLRTVLFVFIGNCGAMAALLPLRTGRYSYHLMPLLILMFAVALVAIARSVSALGRAYPACLWCRAYTRAVVGASLVAMVVLACGQFVFTNELEDFSTRAYATDSLRFPDWEGPMQYVRDHLEEGDIVISLYPHALDFMMFSANDPRFGRDWKSQYWLQTTLILQSTLDDVCSLPRDRRAGTLMISNRQHLEYLFNHKGRIWYCTQRRPQNFVNDREVSEFLRQQMDVVYEDFRTSVMLRDNRNRPAWVRSEDEQLSEHFHEWFLN